ncbi:MAG: glycosyltransferase family 2 protein [Aestuariivirga sp.]|uniref:glycosyltransferase family 2 protein n=1 Tax=Aestuariivirga sp. TaxID=2650926 RepID=UPI0025BF3E9A|nr:glycosyltransferase family 2 protein [Aestuariivirga sp.]MCA3560128.1 glycosyltransferase family 2 protein [Aestuariivirga sp.]
MPELKSRGAYETGLSHVARILMPSISTGVLRTNPFVTVIVPVFNVEQYVGACLRSILAQDYPNFELLIIDDGSADGSRAICEDYAEYDKRIKVFSKRNGGLGSARNFGLERASGDLICFVDSDDRVTTDFVSSFLERILDGHDIAVSDYASVLPDGRILNTNLIALYDGERDPVTHLMLSDNECNAWNKMYRRKVFDNEKLRFGSGWFEDFACIPAIIGSSDSVGFTNRVTYQYVQREGSIISSIKITPLRALDIIDAAKRLMQLEPVFKPRHWHTYYQWKLVLHVLYFRWADLASVKDPDTRRKARTELSTFVNDNIPLWFMTEFVKERLNTGSLIRRLRERKFVFDVRGSA